MHPRTVIAILSLLIAWTADAEAQDVLSAADARFQQLVREGGYPSLAVGAIHGDTVVYEKAFGVADRVTARPVSTETIYRIGSVGKLFTATLLMMLRDAGKLRLDDPVEQYLRHGVRLQTDPRGAPAITFRHLATHTSGLPEWPEKDPTLYDANRPDDVIEQYRGFTADSLEQPTGARFRYSGLGYSLLGHALERAGGDSYEALLQKMLFTPLGMTSTVINLTAEQRKRMPNHYSSDDKVVERDPSDPGPRWAWPTSSHVSTVGDMLRFLRLQRRAGTTDITPVRGGTLAEMHTAQRLQNNWNDAIGIGWWIEPNAEVGDIIWHKGASRGFSSYVAYSMRYELGVVLLTNRNRTVEEIGRAFLVSLARGLRPLRQPTPAEAETYWNSRDWSNAAWAYESILRSKPADATVWFRLGSAYLRTRDCARAMPALRKAVELKAGASSYALFLLARCHAIRGDFTASLTELGRAVDAGYIEEENELSTDADLEPVRRDPRFATIMTRMKRK
jgi:CubicO group peptidase (beta-lactamase class C family)